jgi:hypothetical protein
MIVAEINTLEEEKKKLGVMQVLKLPVGNHVLDWEPVGYRCRLGERCGYRLLV